MQASKQAAGDSGGARAGQLEARALRAPAGGEGGELGVGEVVVGELEAFELERRRVREVVNDLSARADVARVSPIPAQMWRG